MIAKIKTTVMVCVVILSVGRLASATPVIKDWSSEGGNPRNKKNARDRMHLVKPGDKITLMILRQKENENYQEKIINLILGEKTE